MDLPKIRPNASTVLVTGKETEEMTTVENGLNRHNTVTVDLYG
jgi:hypothetical protein